MLKNKMFKKIKNIHFKTSNFIFHLIMIMYIILQNKNILLMIYVK